MNKKKLSIPEIESWLWEPVDSHMSNWQKSLKASLKIVAIFIREFKIDNIPLRACALTFTVVLSLVPILALGTAVLKGLGAGDQMRQASYRFIESLELSASDAPGPRPTTDEKTAPPPTAEEKTITEDSALTNHLRKAADQIFDYVDRTDFATLGAIGIVGLVFSVLSVLGSIEQSMNVIWRARSGRPFGRKLMDYLALMILLPLSVNLALATETTLQNQALFQFFNDLLPTATLTHFLLKALPLFLVTGTFTVLYRFLPNTQVQIFPALSGGVIGGTSWLYAQTLYLKLQIGVAKYNAIYGSFATLPLFLLWLYVGWIIFLAGAEFAYAVQHWHRYSVRNTLTSPQEKISQAFYLLELLFKNYKKGILMSEADIAAKLHSQENEIRQVIKILAQGGLIHQVTENKQNAYVPALPEETMDVRNALELILGPRPTLEHPLASHAFETAAASVSGKSLSCSPNEKRYVSGTSNSESTTNADQSSNIPSNT